MSQFSTGELAKAAEVLLGLSSTMINEGSWRHLKSQRVVGESITNQTWERLQVICFLRDLDFSIKQIQKLLQEENREQVLELLLTDQIESLEKSSEEIEVKLKRARHLQKQLLNDINFRWKICQTFHVLWKIKNHGVICSWEYMGVSF